MNGWDGEAGIATASWAHPSWATPRHGARRHANRNRATLQPGGQPQGERPAERLDRVWPDTGPIRNRLVAAYRQRPDLADESVRMDCARGRPDAGWLTDCPGRLQGAWLPRPRSSHCSAAWSSCNRTPHAPSRVCADLGLLAMSHSPGLGYDYGEVDLCMRRARSWIRRATGRLMRVDCGFGRWRFWSAFRSGDISQISLWTESIPWGLRS